MKSPDGIGASQVVKPGSHKKSSQRLTLRPKKVFQEVTSEAIVVMVKIVINVMNNVDMIMKVQVVTFNQASVV